MWKACQKGNIAQSIKYTKTHVQASPSTKTKSMVFKSENKLHWKQMSNQTSINEKESGSIMSIETNK